MPSHNALGRRLAAKYSHSTTAITCVQSTSSQIFLTSMSYTRQKQELQWLESWRNALLRIAWIPDKFHSDNGPPFNSNEFSPFAAMYEFEHITSSPECPQSNGKVENAVKTSKNLMKKATITISDFPLALLDWRSTPTEGMKSHLSSECLEGVPEQCCRLQKNSWNRS